MTKIHLVDTSNRPYDMQDLSTPDYEASRAARISKIDIEAGSASSRESEIKRLIAGLMHMSDALGFDTYGLVGQAFEMRAADLAEVGHITENPDVPTPEIEEQS